MTDQRARAEVIAGKLKQTYSVHDAVIVIERALADAERRVWEEAAKMARNIPEGWEFQRVERAMIQSVLDDISDSIQAHAGQEG